METPEDRLATLGLHLPPPTRLPENVRLPFSLINLRGDRLFVSGHPRTAADGGIDGPFGMLGADMTTEEGYAAAHDIALSVLANIKAGIGELSRIAGWGRVFGMVASASGFKEQHLVINGFSDLILDVFGPDAGRHARSAIGVAGLPMGFAMEIEAEVLLKP